MRTLYGESYIDKKELMKIGISYPIKLEYYKTYRNQSTKNSDYGIEIVKKSYSGELTSIEKSIIKHINTEDSVVEEILRVLKENQVTPVVAKEVIQDLLCVI